MVTNRGREESKYPLQRGKIPIVIPKTYKETNRKIEQNQHSRAAVHARIHSQTPPTHGHDQPEEFAPEVFLYPQAQLNCNISTFTYASHLE